jgi:hypothetical protein
MKNVILAIAISTMFLTSCSTGTTNVETTSSDSTTVDSGCVVIDTCCTDSLKVTLPVDTTKN